jgi:endonuclease YncB( thermonuclease family)
MSLARTLKQLALFFSMFLLFAPASSFASDLRADLESGGTAVISAVINGKTVKTDDGKTVRLLGIRAADKAPYNETAKKALEDLILRQSVMLYYDQVKTDRHQYTLAHMFLNNGRWVEGELVQAGMARVYPTADNRALIEELQKLETVARAKKVGMWQDESYRVRNAEDKTIAIGSFQLVEGRIVDVAEVKKSFYLNFGADYHSDFTAYIPYKSRKLFRLAKIKPDELEGKKVRVRGWVEMKNGPYIQLDVPEQLEVLE